jgi:hypothetical protein
MKNRNQFLRPDHFSRCAGWRVQYFPLRAGIVGVTLAGVV